MAESIEEARYYEENPDLIVVDPKECKENNIFSWQVYFIMQICEGPVAADNYYRSMPRPHEAALDYMARCWAHEVADRIKHNQFTNWKGVN